MSTAILFLDLNRKYYDYLGFGSKIIIRYCPQPKRQIMFIKREIDGFLEKRVFGGKVLVVYGPRQS